MPNAQSLRALRGLQLGLALVALSGLTFAHPNLASAIPIVTYEAMVAFTVSAAPGPLPFGASLTLFPGVAFTPPPFTTFNGTATNSASASVPGHVQAAAQGTGIVRTEFGEQEAHSTSASSATAIGFGSLANTSFVPTVNFPLLFHEDWRVSAVGPAEAHIQFQVLLDGALIHSGSATAGQGHPGSTANSATVPLTVALEPGFHSLVFTAQADGLAATPEPATLLLVGTTAAGIGLAGWRQRRRKQAAGAQTEL